jgi:hypothetical protein
VLALTAVVVNVLAVRGRTPSKRTGVPTLGV